MLIHKFKTEDKLEYVRFDDGDVKHHIINRTRWRIVYEEEERDWIYDPEEMMTWICTVMDDDTELYIVPAKEVKWCPSRLRDGYFYY